MVPQSKGEMLRHTVGHGRCATGVVAAAVVLALVGCGGASNRAASEIDKHATLANWKPQLPHDEKQRIDDCLGNAVHHPANPLISHPGDPALVPFLPHLVYFSIAEYDLLPGDDVVDVTVYIFDSPSTAARWVLTAARQPGPRNIGRRCDGSARSCHTGGQPPRHSGPIITSHSRAPPLERGV